MRAWAGYGPVKCAFQQEEFYRAAPGAYFCIDLLVLLHQGKRTEETPAKRQKCLNNTRMLIWRVKRKRRGGRKNGL